jgi:hypothetical protein
MAFLEQLDDVLKRLSRFRPRSAERQSGYFGKRRQLFREIEIGRPAAVASVDEGLGAALFGRVFGAGLELGDDQQLAGQVAGQNSLAPIQSGLLEFRRDDVMAECAWSSSRARRSTASTIGARSWSRAFWNWLCS